MVIVMLNASLLGGGKDSGALRNAIRMPTRSIVSSIALNRQIVCVFDMNQQDL
jgi:hypothetical protein